MRVQMLLVLVTFVLGFGDAARRRVRSTTLATVTTISTPASFANRQFMFAEPPSEMQIQWDNYDIQKLDAESKFWQNSNDTESYKSILNTSRQFYPGLPNPGETNELPNPILPQSPPSVPPPQQPAPGCLGLRGQYPSPKSCANYLNCWDDVVIEQTCPAGLLFNDITYVCDFDYNVNCGNRPPATPKPPLPPGSKLCPDPNGRYRSSTNCSEFYVCLSGKPIKFSCPRGLVYNDILNVCDYLYNVDCKGAATPKPIPHSSTQLPSRPSSTNLLYSSTLSSKPSTPSPKPTVSFKPSTYPTQPPAYPTQPPAYPTQPPAYPTQPPTYASPVSTYPPPSYPSQQPTYTSQPSTYDPQPPTYFPQSPVYQPQVVSYPGNPWLNKGPPDPWHQRPPASHLEIEAEKLKQEFAVSQPQGLTESSSLINPWNLFQIVPPELMKTPCNNGDVHRLNEACTNMVVCRNERPQIVRCSSGFSYDKPSDTCRPFSIAKC